MNIRPAILNSKGATGQKPDMSRADGRTEVESGQTDGERIIITRVYHWRGYKYNNTNNS